MKISFDKVKEYQMHYMHLQTCQKRAQIDKVFDVLTENEVNELIEILGKLLYFMHMTHREEI